MTLQIVAHQGNPRLRQLGACFVSFPCLSTGLLIHCIGIVCKRMLRALSLIRNIRSATSVSSHPHSSARNIAQRQNRQRNFSNCMTPLYSYYSRSSLSQPNDVPPVTSTRSPSSNLYIGQINPTTDHSTIRDLFDSYHGFRKLRIGRIVRL